MTFSKEELGGLPLAYATPSLGMHDSHTLPLKISAADSHGYKGIEIGFPDLLAYALARGNLDAPSHKEQPWAEEEPDPFGDEEIWKALAGTAKVVKDDLDKRGMKVILLQPFSQYEGWRGKHEDRRKWVWRKAERWIQLTEILGSEAMQVGSTDEVDSDGSIDVVVEDMRKLADLAAKHNTKISYEPWCWAAYNWDWSHTWEVVKRANHPNLVLCLDTFQIAGAIYADPASSDGLNATHSDPYKALTDSLTLLSTSIPSEKIQVLQISDGMNPPSPLKKDGKTPPRGNWSHAYRPVPFDGGYLPVTEVCEAVLSTGFRGWFSYEVFFEEDQQRDDPQVPERWALKGLESQKKLVEDLLKRK